LGERLKSELGAEIEYLKGSGGAFEISVNGGKIFSKKALHRFPEEEEIVSLLQNI